MFVLICLSIPSRELIAKQEQPTDEGVEIPYFMQIQDIFDNDYDNAKELLDSIRVAILSLSTYYNAFKYSRELERYSESEQIDDVAMFLVDEKKHGKEVATTFLNARIKRTVANNQTRGIRMVNSLRRIITGPVSFIQSAILRLMLYQYAARDLINAHFGYNTYYLKNFLNQEVIANGALNDYLYNPNYWQYVDLYNTFNAEIIVSGIHNQDIVPTKNVHVKNK